MTPFYQNRGRTSKLALTTFTEYKTTKEMIKPIAEQLKILLPKSLEIIPVESIAASIVAVVQVASTLPTAMGQSSLTKQEESPGAHSSSSSSSSLGSSSTTSSPDQPVTIEALKKLSITNTGSTAAFISSESSTSLPNFNP